MEILSFAGANIELHQDGLTVTRYTTGAVPAYPQHGSNYRQTAFELGYGDDVFALSREHEVTHSLLAHWLGLDASPTLIALASDKVFDHWFIEEDAVKAVQRFARLMHVDLIALARRTSGEQVSAGGR